MNHELRTPLTIISNTLALNPQRTLTANERLALQQQTDNLKNIIDVLMSLARAESVNSDTFTLRTHIEECILTIHSTHEEQGFSVTLDIDESISIHANQQLLTLLVLNLLENSLRYAACPKLQISATHTHIMFENALDNPVSHEILNQAVKQNDSTGIGQGLHLVKRIVEALHWQCEVHSDDKIFRFVLLIN